MVLNKILLMLALAEEKKVNIWFLWHTTWLHHWLKKIPVFIVYIDAFITTFVWLMFHYALRGEKGKGLNIFSFKWWWQWVFLKSLWNIHLLYAWVSFKYQKFLVVHMLKKLQRNLYFIHSSKCQKDSILVYIFKRHQKYF